MKFRGNIVDYGKSHAKNQQFTTALTSDDGSHGPLETAGTESDIRSVKQLSRPERGQRTAARWQSVSP